MQRGAIYKRALPTPLSARIDSRGPIEFLFQFVVYECLYPGDLAFYLTTQMKMTMTTATKPIFFGFKFLHTHTVYSSYLTI